MTMSLYNALESDIVPQEIGTFDNKQLLFCLEVEHRNQTFDVMRKGQGNSGRLT